MRPTPDPLRRVLAEISRSDLVRPVDLALARLLGAIDQEHDGSTRRTAAVALAAALASVQARGGSSLVDLAEVGGDVFPGESSSGHEALAVLPAAGGWRSRLAESPVVGAPGEASPLVLDGDTVSLARFWHAERRVARGVTDRVRASAAPSVRRLAASGGEAPPAPMPSEAVLTPEVRDLFAELFPARAPEAAPDWQAVAVAAALNARVVFVAGGPGTGKTFTAARLLAVLQAAHPALDVALAAPTGKAAQRLGESLASAADALPEAVASMLPTRAPGTLHALLGMRRSGGAPRFGAGRPLPHDLVLVDEGSMVSLPLFDALLAALAPGARLVVLGDPDQLESVEAGAVFGDVCALGAGHASRGFAARCADLGLAIPATDVPTPLADAVVTLTESRRFEPASGIGRLATALRDGDGDTVREVLTTADDARAVEAEAVGRAVRWAVEGARAVVGAPTPAEALAALGQRQLLAAVRRGPSGVEGLNTAVEAELRARGDTPWTGRGDPFYNGRPLLVTENRHADGLANGDIGVCWTVDGRREVHFPDGDATRAVPLGQLPPTEPAWALTIHKSQGSEFDAVGVVLPDSATARRPVSRGLLYTAVTRARREVVVFGPVDEAAEAAGRPSGRRSALRARLTDALAEHAESEA